MQGRYSNSQHTATPEKRLQPLGFRDLTSKNPNGFRVTPLRPLEYCSRYVLQPYYYSKNPPWRQLPGRVFFAFLSHRPARRMARTAFWTWRRFSASSKISLAWSSKTALEISSPRWAGRQCSTMWSGLAPASRLPVSW